MFGSRHQEFNSKGNIYPLTNYVHLRKTRHLRVNICGHACTVSAFFRITTYTVHQRFPYWGTGTPGCTPEVFQWVRGGLAEAKVTCNGAKVFFVVHEGENVFMYYYQIHT